MSSLTRYHIGTRWFEQIGPTLASFTLIGLDISGLFKSKNGGCRAETDNFGRREEPYTAPVAVLQWDNPIGSNTQGRGTVALQHGRQVVR